MLKRIIIIILILFAVLSLYSCAKRTGKEPVEIKFWYAWGGEEGKFLESMIDEFNKSHPHIRVKGSFFNIGDKLLASIAGGKPPDVATVWDFMFVTMGESGCFLPLEDKLIKSGITKDSYLPNIWDYGIYREHKWGVPTTLNAWGIFYNRKLVKDAGLDPENPPTTTDELAKWGEKLTIQNNEGNIVRIGYVPVMTNVWLYNFDGLIFDKNEQKFVLNSEQNIKALEWMQSFYKKVGMGNYRRFSAGFGRLDSPQNPFYVGKIAIREDGQWQIQFANLYAPGLDYGVFLYPASEPGKHGRTVVDSSFWVIPVGTKHPDEAWEFLRWLMDPEQNSRFCAKLLNIPPLKESLQKPVFQEVLRNEKFKFFVDQVLNGYTVTNPAMPVAQQFNDNLGQGTEMVFSDKISPRDFLKKLDEKMNKELARQKKLLGID